MLWAITRVIINIQCNKVGDANQDHPVFELNSVFQDLVGDTPCHFYSD